ncbi:MAG: 33 kDa chaperonin [Oligoflexia bacterium]|nr:MAG: 33 kDa chaperonin [Oligoflexia bacterium]
MSRVYRFVTNDFTVRAAAVDATAVVQEMQKIQNTLPLATIGVGRAIVGAALMASHLKEGQQVGLLFKGNGPLASVYAESTFEGHVRGYCPSPDYQAPKAEDAMNLGKALGFGTLNVSRHQPFQRQPHHGTVAMTSGEIGDDIAHYLHQSHQIRSLISLGVYLDTYGKVKAAGGVLIEVMPGVEEGIVDLIQKNADQQKGSISKLILDGTGAMNLIQPYLAGIPFTEIPHDYQLQYFCPCTEERVRGALSVMGEDGLQEMIDDGKGADVSCQVCGRKYEISLDVLKDIQEGLRKNSLH